jgi:hypothetical protein
MVGFTVEGAWNYSNRSEACFAIDIMTAGVVITSFALKGVFEMTLLRWIARILSGLVIAFGVLSFLGDHRPFVTLSMTDKIGLSVMGVILLGMLLAWRWERTGGLIIVGGFVLLAIINQRILSLWAMWIIPFIGVLFFISWQGNRKKTTAAQSANERS